MNTKPLGITRRGFLLGAATGLAAGIPTAWLAGRHYFSHLSRQDRIATPDDPQASYAMPGPYPGRVVEVRHPRVVSPQHHIDRDAVREMVNKGMAELTNTEPRDIKSAWGTFFEKGDVVGIKVNPVGRKPFKGEYGRVPGAVGAISSPEVLAHVIYCLRVVGIPAQDIIVFERYAEEFATAGYADLVQREFPGVRWYASAIRYSNEQVDIKGFDQGRDACSPELARHVVGYDPDVFTVMGYCAPSHDNKDDRRFRSHLSLIATRMVNKIITLPVLKDHRSAGVTLTLKNMSHGMNNNVARSHLVGIPYGLGRGPNAVSGPNQCNTFIPQAVAHHALRQKATLHILDGLIGVYEGGPGCWNKTWGTWRHEGLFFATDPVALDHVGWDLINAKRVQEGWPAVERMGLMVRCPEAPVSTALASLAGQTPLDKATLTLSAKHHQQGRGSEIFNVRQPDHIILAGQLGLGVFPREQIHHQQVMLPEASRPPRVV